jgi:hypothetical protein
MPGRHHKRRASSSSEGRDRQPAWDRHPKGAQAATSQDATGHFWVLKEECDVKRF